MRLKVLFRVLAVIAIVLYFAIGAVLVLSESHFTFVPIAWRNSLGIVLLVYGVYRSARLYPSLKAVDE